VAVTERGFIAVNIQMRTNVPHIFAIGDIVGQPMLAHKAVHKAHLAAEAIAGELQGDKELAASAFNARVIPSVAAPTRWTSATPYTRTPRHELRRQHHGL
jgi:dihydrolipoamide dehydrogenase